jgi:hypothetical protein
MVYVKILLFTDRGVANGVAMLDGSILVPTAQLGGGVASGTTYLRGDRTWATPAGGGGAAISTAAVPFTDGDTLRRITVADAAVTPSSKIIATVRRPDTTDDQDPGYLYLVNVTRVATGAFDALIACLGWGFDDPTERPPNETITLAYVTA